MFIERYSQNIITQSTGRGNIKCVFYPGSYTARLEPARACADWLLLPSRIYSWSKVFPVRLSKEAIRFLFSLIILFINTFITKCYTPKGKLFARLFFLLEFNPRLPPSLWMLPMFISGSTREGGGQCASGHSGARVAYTRLSVGFCEINPLFNPPAFFLKKKSTNMVIKVYVSMITFTQEVSMEDWNFYCVFEAPVWI